MNFPEIVDMVLPVEGGFHTPVFVSIRWYYSVTSNLQFLDRILFRRKDGGRLTSTRTAGSAGGPLPASGQKFFSPSA
jgi:hypothetical protein